MSLLLSGSMLKLPAGASEPSGPDDDFETGTIAPFWTAQNTGTATIVETGGQLVITCPTGTAFDWYSGTRTAPYLEQAFTPGSGDFTITADFSASNGGSGPTAKYQGHGFLILQDTTNNLRFDAFYNTSLLAFCAKMTSGTSVTQYSNAMTSTHWKYLRVTRLAADSGQWRFYGSPDGVSFTSLGSAFTHSITINKVALFAHRSDAAGQYVANVESIAFT